MLEDRIQAATQVQVQQPHNNLAVLAVRPPGAYRSPYINVSQQFFPSLAAQLSVPLGQPAAPASATVAGGGFDDSTIAGNDTDYPDQSHTPEQADMATWVIQLESNSNWRGLAQLYLTTKFSPAWSLQWRRSTLGVLQQHQEVMPWRYQLQLANDIKGMDKYLNATGGA
jgi:hypothetical protein